MGRGAWCTSASNDPFGCAQQEPQVRFLASEFKLWFHIFVISLLTSSRMHNDCCVVLLNAGMRLLQLSAELPMLKREKLELLHILHKLVSSLSTHNPLIPSAEARKECGAHEDQKAAGSTQQMPDRDHSKPTVT